MDIRRNHRNNMNTSSRDSFEFEVSVRVHGNVLATGRIILQHMYSLFFFLKNTIEPAKRLISPGQPFITARKYQKHMHGSERSVKIFGVERSSSQFSVDKSPKKVDNDRRTCLSLFLSQKVGK